jgi:tetratricopeptide (TPR) repeat protein
MAIEKVEGKKYEMTPKVMIQLGVAGLLVILSLLFGYLAFSRWRFKSNLLDGFRAHDIRSPDALTSLRNAHDWNPEHPGALQTLAKVEVESGRLAEAERSYQKMGAGRASVRAGLGVLNLKKAMAASDPAEVKRLVGQAMQEFKAASGIPESEIGLGHCELVLAHKLGETTRLSTAKAIFGKVKPDGRITREGMLDYHAGLGKAASGGTKYDPASRESYRICAQIEAGWPVPQKSLIAAEAIRFARWQDPPTQELTATKAETMKLLLDFSNKWKSNAAMWNEFKEQWMFFALAAAEAYARAGMEKEFSEFLAQLSGFGDRIEPLQVEAAGRSAIALREDASLSVNERAKLVGAAFAACDRLLPKLKPENDPKNEWRARTQNTMGVLEAWRAANQNQPIVYQRALDRFNEALKIAPNEYAYNRNAALALKRQKKPATAIQPFLDKAKAAGTGENAADFAELEKVLGGN